MKVGIIGSGGREHALCVSLKKSNLISKIYCIPGNAGTSIIAENIDIDINNFSKIHNGPILIAHSDIKVTGEAIKVARKNFNGVLGAYPNRGHYEKPNWKFVDNITPEEYLENAKSWVKDGVNIVGGCCGVGVEEIKAISVLKNYNA